MIPLTDTGDDDRSWMDKDFSSITFDVTPEVRKALEAFDFEELQELSWNYDETTYEYLGIGFTDPSTGKLTRYTDPVKVAACDVLDAEMRKIWPEIKRFYGWR